jgi:hypothetical protein
MLNMLSCATSVLAVANISFHFPISQYKPYKKGNQHVFTIG